MTLILNKNLEIVHHYNDYQDIIIKSNTLNAITWVITL